MAIKKKDSGGGGGANWMDTYGDMVTLLLCFFVLLYSMSTISEENWKALVMSFNPDAAQTITATPGGDGPNADADKAGGDVMIPQQLTQADVEQEIEALFVALQEMAASDQMSDSVSVTKDGGKIFVTFNQATFFDGDSAVLREESYPILDSVSEMLNNAAAAIDEVRILGHTAVANYPKNNTIRNDRMLSSNRATNVLIYIQEKTEELDPDLKLDPARMVSVGMGQWQPVATNSTAEGRAQNRRVELIISGRNLEEEMNNGIENYYTTTTTGAPSYSTTASAS